MITSCSINTSNTNNPSLENEVKIKKISAYDNQADNAQILNRKESNRSQDELNYIIIYKSQIDIQFTITLDNPEAYGIDALRVKCDDEDAQIQVDGEWKPIAFEDDGTRVVNWDSEDPYEKTYNIRTTSDDAVNTFEVVDIRLAGHSKFQSKETKNTDIGNSELQIHKIDEDAYRVDVIENTFEYIKFKLAVKESYKDIIHNITVDGETADSEGIYTLYENKNIKVKYDYKINDELMVKRSNNEEIKKLKVCYQKPVERNFDYHENIPVSRAELGFDENDTTVWKNCIHLALGFEGNDWENYISVYYKDVKCEIVETLTWYETIFDNDTGEPISSDYYGHTYFYDNDCFSDIPYEITRDYSVAKYLNNFKIVILEREYKILYEIAFDDLVDNDKPSVMFRITGLKEI